MKLISLTCPNCNANLDNIDPSLKQCYCQYCGTKIMLDDGTIRKETHIYDEAKIKESESKERIELAKMEHENKRVTEENKEERKNTIFYVILVLIILLLWHFF